MYKLSTLFIHTQKKQPTPTNGAKNRKKPLRWTFISSINYSVNVASSLFLLITEIKAYDVITKDSTHYKTHYIMHLIKPTIISNNEESKSFSSHLTNSK